MHEENLLIIHISDLHVGSKLKRDALEKAINEVTSSPA
jgi:DNA repair exonuclease SbcCD nuclease subunit